MSEPSFSNGFASPWYDGRMKYPDLWRGCVGAWAPLLGPTGATLFDVSGRSKHGTLTNMDPATDLVVGRYGHALDLDGSNDYVSCGTGVGLFQTTDRFSISTHAFVRNVTSQQEIMAKWQVSASGGWQWFIHTDGRLHFLHTDLSGSSIRWASGSTVLTVNTHYTLSVTYDGSNAASGFKFYVNGIPGTTTVVSDYGPGTSGDSALWIGSRQNGAGDTFWNAIISDIAMWSRTLTSNELTLLAQRPGIMLELDDSDAWGAVEAGGSVPWWAFANRQSRIIGGGVT